MHDTALINAQLFRQQWFDARQHQRVLELGAGSDHSLRNLFQDTCYETADHAALPGIDHVLAHAYQLPWLPATWDCVIASSVFEHTPWFWETFVECQRILRPGGIMYVQVPSNGPVHRFPVDCWRFYPDAADALASYAQHRGYPCRVLEQKITEPIADIWHDFVAVFERR